MLREHCFARVVRGELSLPEAHGRTVDRSGEVAPLPISGVLFSAKDAAVNNAQHAPEAVHPKMEYPAEVRAIPWRSPKSTLRLTLPGLQFIVYRVVEMIFSRLALLPTIVAAILLTIGGFAVPAGASEPVELRIEIFVLGGFHVLTNHTKLVASRDRYEIVMDLDTQNIASLFVDLKSHSEVRGRLTTGAAYPDAYRGDVRRNDTERHYWIDYRADGTVTSDSALPSVALRGTVDQMTAFLIVERQLARRGTCSRVVPVFDGLGRYNLRFVDAQQRSLPVDSRQQFAGTTQVCDVTREDMAGFPGNADQAAGTYRQGKIWYTRDLAGVDEMIPVRMEFDTEFGAIHALLADLHGLGIDRQFMQ